MCIIELSMTIQTAEKIYREVQQLRKETESLRGLVLAILHDPEGDYKSSFIRRVLINEKKKADFSFRDPQSFLKSLGL